MGAELFFPLTLVLFAWAFSYQRLNPNAIALTSLLLVSLIRLGGVEIGEWDIQGLREETKEVNQISYFVENQDIWHEYGLISSALGKVVKRIEDPKRMNDFLSHGGTVIFSDEIQNRPTPLQCTDWVRLKRRLRFPVDSLLFKGLSIDDPDLHRIFKICKTPPS